VYFDRLGRDFDPEAFLTGVCEQAGRQAEVAHAMSFELIEP
jgi:hypothetical protein